jgi:hypothetical protein
LSEGKKGVKSARFDLLPWDALWVVALVFGKGAEKYAERNWERGYEWSKSKGAQDRHDALFNMGEDFDDESELPHLAHVAWHALVRLAFFLREAGVDDRPLTLPGIRESLEKMAAEVTNPEDIEAAKREVELSTISRWPGAPT